MCNKGEVKAEHFVRVEETVGCPRRRLKRMWSAVLSNMQTHLDNHENEYLQPVLHLLNTSLPVSMFPDSIFQSNKMGVCGRKKKHDREALKEAT